MRRRLPLSMQSRRGLLGLFAALPFAGAAEAVAAVRTPRATEGPFYPTAPMRFPDIDNDLVKVDGLVREAGGEILHLSGRVFDAEGRPASGARVEIWQCDAGGRYLHRGDRGGAARDAAFQGFGHDVADEDGAYAFRTIKPVPYPGRTPHIHVKVFHGGRELTTQFYLADEPLNASDGLYRRLSDPGKEAVTMRLARDGDAWTTARDIQL